MCLEPLEELETQDSAVGLGGIARDIYRSKLGFVMFFFLLGAYFWKEQEMVGYALLLDIGFTLAPAAAKSIADVIKTIKGLG